MRRKNDDDKSMRIQQKQTKETKTRFSAASGSAKDISTVWSHAAEYKRPWLLDAINRQLLAELRNAGAASSLPSPQGEGSPSATLGHVRLRSQCMLCPVSLQLLRSSPSQLSPKAGRRYNLPAAQPNPMILSPMIPSFAPSPSAPFPSVELLRICC